MSKSELLMDLIVHAYAGLQMSVRAKELFDNFTPGDLSGMVEKVNEIRGDQWEIPKVVFEFYDLETPGQIRRSCIEIANRAINDAVLLGWINLGVFEIPADLPIDRVQIGISGIMVQLLRAASSKMVAEANFYGSNGVSASEVNVNGDKDSTGNNVIKRKVGEDEGSDKIKSKRSW